MLRLADLELSEKNAVKAREWLEKAATLGNAIAKGRLAEIAIAELFAAGKFAETLKAQTAYAALVEAEETGRVGRSGSQTAKNANVVAWYALFARDFPLALSAAERAHALEPTNLLFETNRAHALMMLERTAEARELYLTYRGKPLAPGMSKTWQTVIRDDFRELRQAGITHPMMVEIEQAFDAMQ